MCSMPVLCLLLTYNRHIVVVTLSFQTWPNMTNMNREENNGLNHRVISVKAFLDIFAVMASKAMIDYRLCLKKEVKKCGTN